MEPDSKKLHEVKVREHSGRDTILRYNLQFKAAAFASLQILDGKEVDRVYCDYMDDFVVRYQIQGKHVYHFFQVKTKDKRNYQWSISEVSGLKGKGKNLPDAECFEKVRQSFLGKLLLHAINFGMACKQATLMTNVHFRDEVESFIAAVQSGGENPHVKFLLDQFGLIFESCSALDANATRGILRKFAIHPNVSYIDPNSDDFDAQARSAIYRFSEIDLSHSEITEIARALTELVHKKSFQKILCAVTESELDEKAGIGIDELLRVLSISKVAYSTLLKDGDEKALKNASIIQRALKKANANDEMIEFCSRLKVRWDIWVREKRHSIPELRFNDLIERLAKLERQWHGAEWDWIKGGILELSTQLQAEGFNEADPELLLGGFFSAHVKGRAL
jgi:hypothetical protein